MSDNFMIFNLISFYFYFVGIASIKVRVPDKTNGTRAITIKIKLDVSAEDLYAEVGARLEHDPKR